MGRTLTKEQAQVVRFNGFRLVVKARAGSGKTTTLVALAKMFPYEPMLYVAYNRAIRDEAARKFPKNGLVKCQTSHQMAFPTYGKLLNHKFSPSRSVSMREMANALNTHSWSYVKDVQDVVNNFMCGAEEIVSATHFTRFDDIAIITTKMLKYQADVIEAAQMIFGKMSDPQDEFPTVDDCYLKLYQLSKPDLSSVYSRILFDEAQDANRVTSDIILNQQCKLVLVGDEHQQIFRYRGADNALDHPLLADARRLYLTNSFRFGSNVAIVANTLLEIKDETIPVVGLGPVDTVGSDMPPEGAHYMHISRTNMGVIATALSACASGKSIFWIGGINGYQINDLIDLSYFSTGDTDLVKNKKLKAEYRDIEDYREVAKETKNSEMLRGLRLIDTYDPPLLQELLANLKKQTVEVEIDAHITVTTAHRSKGLESEYVVLGDDFPDIFNPQLKIEDRNDEINLLYVACTRAMVHLTLNTTVQMVLAQAVLKRRVSLARAL